MEKNNVRKSLFLVLLILCLFMISCKETKSDIEWVNEGIAMISDEIDLEDENLINSIRILYDNLTLKEQKKIKNYHKLVDAENKIYNLKIENGTIVELKYSIDLESVKLEYIDTEYEKILSDESLNEFLVKLSEVSGEKVRNQNFSQSKSIKLTINEDIIICYLDINYFTYNESTYVFKNGNLNFIFDYFK